MLKNGHMVGHASRAELCRYTEAGYLEPDNNYAERCLRPVALGSNFLFVGSERAGRAAAIYYSLVASCKGNKVNPLTYMTYVLSHVGDKRVTLRCVMCSKPLKATRAACVGSP